jgi:hypothetical protein
MLSGFTVLKAAPLFTKGAAVVLNASIKSRAAAFVHQATTLSSPLPSI